MARAPVSKTGGWGFESLHSCQAKVFRQESVCRRSFIRFAGAAPLLILAGRGARSQAARTVKFVVPFPAGGGADLLTRVLAQQVGATAGVTTVVENRPGAASIVGTEYVSRAAPDGNTVLTAANSFIIHPFFKRLNYDPLTSFAPISWLANSPQVIVVNSASPYHTLSELIDAARAKPGQLTHASVGPATTQHIAFELLKLRAKIDHDLRAVQRQRPGHKRIARRPRRYRDGELLGSRREHQGGQPASLGGGIARTPGMAARRADRRRVRLSRVTKFTSGTALLAPAGTPAAVVDQLSQWADGAMLAPELKPKWDLQGLDPVGKPSAELAAHLRQQQEEYGQIIHEANIQGE